MNAYYNEHDPFAAGWLRELIAAGAITPGFVDERDIQLVQPDDLRGFTRCHFFAGIGGWDYALRLAGWPADRPIWTGSCPCQPFSNAGKGEGFNDTRHLWPTWFRLIRECRPSVVFGEQVAGTSGEAWLDHVSTEMESQDYAFGAADLPAASVGAPTKRNRLLFVASTNAGGVGLEGGGEPRHRQRKSPSEPPWAQTVRRTCCQIAARGWADDEPLPEPVAHGLSSRLVVGGLRCAGNAIVPQVAAEFIGAFLEVSE